MWKVHIIVPNHICSQIPNMILLLLMLEFTADGIFDHLISNSQKLLSLYLIDGVLRWFDSRELLVESFLGDGIDEHQLILLLVDYIGQSHLFP